MKKLITAVSLIGTMFIASSALADYSDVLGVVTLSDNGNCSYAGTFNGQYYFTLESPYSGNCKSAVLQIYLPPSSGNGNATLVTSKQIRNSDDNTSVDLSALAWDPIQNEVWGIQDTQIWLIDIGDPLTNNEDALATLKFNVPDTEDLHVDGVFSGLAFDPNNNILYYTPEGSCLIHKIDSDGLLPETIDPVEQDWNDCLVSGIMLGLNDTLYIGRSESEIQQISQTGEYIDSLFASRQIPPDPEVVVDHIKNLSCDSVNYASDAILAKDFDSAWYMAIEIEPGTCPLVEEPEPPIEIEVALDIKPTSCPNPLNLKSKGVLPVAILGTSDFDVSQVDPGTILLGGAPPLRWAYEDVATPFKPFIEKSEKTDCTTAGPDGYPDLTLKFDTQAVVTALDVVNDRDVITLQLTGATTGTDPISVIGEDAIVILKK